MNETYWSPYYTTERKDFKRNRGDLLKKDTRIIISFHTNSKLEK